jgi:uncharacterized membrane protein YhaH (DUF805 family)
VRVGLLCIFIKPDKTYYYLIDKNMSWRKRMFKTRLGRLNHFLGNIFLSIFFSLFFGLIIFTFNIDLEKQSLFGNKGFVPGENLTLVEDISGLTNSSDSLSPISKIFSSTSTNYYGIYVIILFLVIFFLLLLFSYSLTIRRLHDLNSGILMYFLLLAPILNLVILFLIFFRPGKSEDNKYGPPSVGGIKEIFIPGQPQTVTNTNSQTTDIVLPVSLPKPPIANTPSFPNISATNKI